MASTRFLVRKYLHIMSNGTNVTGMTQPASGSRPLGPKTRADRGFAQGAGFCFDRNIRIVRAARSAYLTHMATNAILSEAGMKSTQQPTAEQIENRRWQAALERDSSQDGVFVFAVSSTGVFCRPSCPAKRPRRENVSFFSNAQEAEQAGYRACLRCRPKAVDGDPQSAQVRAICRYIEQHIADQHEDRLTLSLLAKQFRRSPFHLQRMLKSALGVSPKAYMDAVRLRQVKQNLQTGHDVTTALYAAGYGSSSRLYERTAAQMGMTPEKYRRGAVAAVLRYTIAGSPLGRMLIAATDKGICSIQFAENDDQLQQGLMREFPFATRRRDDAALSEWRVSLTRLIEGREANPSLPLDIRATAFQRRVWEALQRIPRGETRSYSAVAKKIGMPKATRAVARACATNPAAVAIPCHRVIREDGAPGGYRWGIQRKEQILAREKEAIG
jgi:AraC family transcriptional regulator, regulatory protein of adaptative response / methylated-DNA-[protein]-cysteine methyltransferase